MAITAAELQVRFTAEGARDVEGAIDRVDGRVREATGGFDAFFDSIQGGAGNALRALDGLSRVMGSIALVGGVTLIAGGARAAWQQVDAVQQATIALRAYEQDARAVDDVLSDLLRFARSDAGRLFMRQELFHAAQVMKVAGAETQNLSRYVEIMSRAVSTGMTTFTDLERVLARVVSTGRLTTIEFELLQQAGFMLDESLRNTTVTAEELFDALDRGSVEVLGQTETIQGRMMQLQTAIRGVGLAFLDVDSETSMFREGGLGARLMEGLEAAPAVLANVADAARGLGEAIVGVIDTAANFVNWFRELPGWVQSSVTSILKLVAAFGALRVAGSALGMVGGVMGLGGMMGGVRTLMGGGLFRTGAASATGFGSSMAALVGRINPVGAALAAGAVVMLDWINVAQQAKQAAESYELSLKGLGDTITQLKIYGELDLARQAEDVRGLIEGSRSVFEEVSGADDFMRDWAEKRFIDPTELWLGRADDYRYEFQAMSRDYQEMLDHLEGMDGALAKVNQGLTMDNIDNAQFLADVLDRFREAGDDPVLLSGAFAWLENVDFADYALQIDEVDQAVRRLGATFADVQEIFIDLPGQLRDLRLDGMHRQASQIERLAEVWERAFTPEMLPGATGEYVLVDDLDVAKLEVLGDNWERINEALASGNFDNVRLLTDLMTVLTDDTMSLDEQADAIDAITDSLHEYLAVAQDVIDVLGQSDLTSMLNLAGIGGEAVEAAANVNQLAASLDTLFRVIVGNTNAIASQMESIFKWADELIAEEGVWSKLDDLLDAGRITGKHGEFTGDSDYARAQQAYNQIAEANLRIQEHVLTIQAKQAPLLAANAVALEEYMAQIADMGGAEQLAALGFMDAGLQEQLGTIVNLAGQFKQMEGGADAFYAVAEGIMHTNPALFSMMETMGLIVAKRDEITGEVLSFEVNLDGATTVQDSLNDLIESIDALTLALGGIPPVRVDTSEVDPAIEKLNQLADAARNAVTAGLNNIGSMGNNAARTGSRDAGADTWGDTGVPVVTGLPSAGTGGTVTFTADHSAVNEAVERVSAMVAVVDGMEATVSIGADGSAYGETISQLSASLFAVNDWSATVQIYGDGSAYGETITELWSSLMAVNDWSATVSIYADASDVYKTIADLQIYQGATIATSYVDVVTRRIGDNIVGRATGGFVSEDMTLVGERGPELVSLPRGSYVHTNAETMRMMNSGKGNGTVIISPTITNHIDASGKDVDEERIAELAADRTMQAIKIVVGEQRTGHGMV